MLVDSSNENNRISNIAQDAFDRLNLLSTFGYCLELCYLLDHSHDLRYSTKDNRLYLIIYEKHKIEINKFIDQYSTSFSAVLSKNELKFHGDEFSKIKITVDEDGRLEFNHLDIDIANFNKNKSQDQTFYNLEIPSFRGRLQDLLEYIKNTINMDSTIDIDIAQKSDILNKSRSDIERHREIIEKKAEIFHILYDKTLNSITHDKSLSSISCSVPLRHSNLYNDFIFDVKNLTNNAIFSAKFKEKFHKLHGEFISNTMKFLDANQNTSKENKELIESIALFDEQIKQSVFVENHSSDIYNSFANCMKSLSELYSQLPKDTIFNNQIPEEWKNKMRKCSKKISDLIKKHLPWLDQEFSAKNLFCRISIDSMHYHAFTSIKNDKDILQYIKNISDVVDYAIQIEEFTKNTRSIFPLNFEKYAQLLCLESFAPLLPKQKAKL